MEKVHQVLSDCHFAYTENIKYERTSKKIKTVQDDTRILTVKMPYIEIEIRPTYQDEIIHTTLKFIGKCDESQDLKNIKTLATDLACMRNVVDVPRLYINNDIKKLEYMMRLDTLYEFSVIINILCNFPQNLSINELL